jgi:putative hydrolase of the HAD superfamily
MAAPVRAVFLDVGGVLLLPPPEAAWAALGETGVLDPERHRRAHYAGMAAFDRAGGDAEAYLGGFCLAYGVSEARLAQATAALQDTLRRTPWSTVFEDSVSGLRALAATGVGLAIISNSDGTVERQLTSLGICQVGAGPGVTVASIIDSHVVGVRKPDPAIFQHALRATGVGPDQAMHVGDSLVADVEGAQRVGLRPVHFDPLGACPDDRHRHARSLHDVAARLAGQS